MNARRALIVGAGIGGLAAGVALQRAGWHVRVFERAANPREVGFGLGLAPNAMAALRELRVADALIAEGIVTTTVEVRRADGRVLGRFDASGSGAVDRQSIVALRAALHHALLDTIGPDTVAVNSEAVDFTPAGTGVVLALADGRTATGDVLIGADGVGSVIRKRLHPHEPPARRSGFCALRGVAYGAAHHLGHASAVGYFGDGIEAGIARASADAVYWYLSLLACDIPAGDREPRSVLERYVLQLDDQFQMIAAATKAEDLRFDELFDRDPIRSWGTGCVTLLGDAAHPMLPHTAQGAAQALEDAVALGLVLTPPGDTDAALRRYERVRSARANRIVKRGPRIARVTTTRNRAIGGLRNAAVRTAVRLARGRLLVAAASLARTRDPHRELRQSGLSGN